MGVPEEALEQRRKQPTGGCPSNERYTARGKPVRRDPPPGVGAHRMSAMPLGGEREEGEVAWRGRAERGRGPGKGGSPGGARNL